MNRIAMCTLATAVALMGCDGGNGAPNGATRYTLRVENVAGTAFPTAISSGVWAAHAEADPFFTEGMPDRGEGLEALAEDGDPTALAGTLDPQRGGTFVASGMGDATAAPGDFFETEVWVTGDAPKLSFAAMVVETNDVFLAPSGQGIDLGGITGETDITDQIRFWNAGTETDEAPGLGPNQAPRQEAPNTGSREGVIRHFTSSTRTMPLAFDIVEIEVVESGGTYTLTFQNVTEERGAFVTRISPISWAVHSDAHRLYTAGEPAPAGLEDLAEIADARALTRESNGAEGVLRAGVASERVGSGEPGLAGPGEAFAIEVTPDAEHPYVSVATGIAGGNDLFLGFDDRGLRLLEEDGTPRSAAAVQHDARRLLAVWDAGTETNEVPAAGWHQGADGGIDAGEADPDNRVRRYDDVTNDVGGPGANGFVDVRITHQSDTTFEVHVANRSDALPFRALLTPFVYIVHDEVPTLFDVEAPQSPGLIVLGEDCLTHALYTEMVDAPGVLLADVAHQPDAASESAPIRPGESFTFTVTANPSHRYFNMASMPYPSNDMFVAFDPPGIALLDESGAPRSDADIASDVAAHFWAWDTGTEANQGGGGGYDNVPLQNERAMQDVGPSEGDGTVRAEPHSAFSFPAVDEMVRVTITPVGG